MLQDILISKAILAVGVGHFLTPGFMMWFQQTHRAEVTVLYNTKPQGGRGLGWVLSPRHFLFSKRKESATVTYQFLEMFLVSHSQNIHLQHMDSWGSQTACSQHKSASICHFADHFVNSQIDGEKLHLLSSPSSS